MFEAIQGLVSRITDALGINANGFVLGVAVALFLWWSSNKDKELRAKQAALAAQQRDATAAASTSAAADVEADGDVDEAAHKEAIDKLLGRAQHHRKTMNDEKLTVEHLVLSLAENPRFTEILECAQGLSEDQIKAAIRKSRAIFNRGTNNEELVPEHQTALSKFTRNLTEMAKAGKLDPVVGRNDELRRVLNILSRRTKNNPVILGDPGVGKTSLVDGLALRIAAGDVPDVLAGCSVMALDMGMLMAGAFMPGEFEERMKNVLQELTESVDGAKYILFIDDIHTVTGPNAQQGGGVMDASILLKPLLSRGELRCIGATTLDKYRKFIEKDPALERRFQQVPIEAPNVALTVSILRGVRLRYEKHHTVRITDKALVAAAALSDRYITDRYLPDKAIDLIDEATARVKMEKTLKPETLDRTERRIRELEAERRILRRSAVQDKGDVEVLTTIEAELDKLRTRRGELSDSYSEELGEMSELSTIQDEIDRLNEEIEEAEDAGDESKADALRTTRQADLTKQMRIAQKRLAEARRSNKRGPPVLSSRGEVGEADIARVISIPLTKLVEDERDRLLALSDELHKRIIGQGEAVEAVCEAIHRSRAGMKDPDGPIASFLFLGPTGVGKTELAKALATYLFNSEEAMVRLDMSEYMEKHAVSKLIGAPPGYVGFDEGGQLTEQVRRRPYTVVLFDEVEKAHVDVFNLLLQILDDGRVTDSQGRTVSFRNVIIIMTSNLGSNEIYREAAERMRELKSPGEAPPPPKPGQKSMKELVMDQVRRHFKPEFVNRIDEFIIFEPLRSDEIRHIVKLRLGGVVKRLAERKMKLVMRDSAVDYLATKGFDPVFGARPVKRVIQRELETTLARALIRAEFAEGDTVLVTCPPGDAALLFRCVPQGSPMPADDDDGPPTASVAATQASSAASSNGKDPAASGPKGPMAFSAPPRELKFDPLKKISAAQQSGADISKDGSAARSDPSTLPTSEG